MTFDWAVPYSDEKSHVEIYSERDPRLNNSTVPVGHLRNHMQHHPQCEFMSVIFRERHASILVRAYVWPPCTKYSHVGESDSQ